MDYAAEQLKRNFSHNLHLESYLSPFDYPVLHLFDMTRFYEKLEVWRKLLFLLSRAWDKEKKKSLSQVIDARPSNSPLSKSNY